MVLLDTCTLLWLAADHSKLSQAALEALATADTIFVSAISAFEIGIKSRKGALSLAMEPEIWYQTALDFHGLREIGVSGQIVARSTSLQPLHADPCDRIIVATAQIHRLTILTPDPLIKAYPQTDVLW